MSAPHLIFHTSNRLEVLVERLASDLEVDPPGPLEPEILVVQSQGVYRWLTLELTRRLGIAAGLSMPFPATFCHHLAEVVASEDAWPAAANLGRQAASPFSREILTWRLFAHLGNDDLHEDPRWRDGPGAYLGDDRDGRKRYQLAERLGRLFDDYQLFRPEMVLGWDEGQATAAGGVEAWQAMLWRRLTAAADEDHLSRRLARMLDTLGRATPSGLPKRVSVFGVSTLPPVFLQVIVALSRHVPVKLYFVSPTHHYWGDLRSEREIARIPHPDPLPDPPSAPSLGEGAPALTDDLHLEEGHPLLVALGRQGRDFFNLLQSVDEDGTAWQELDFVEPESDSTLHRLQADILHLNDEPHLLDPADESLRVHVCHSPMREMEVLRDVILEALVHHDDLRPSDVMVLVPDITLYGPYIRAVFGVEHRGTPQLPFTIADRRAGEEQPPAETVLEVLALVAGRLVPRDVLDLLDVAAIRRAAGIEAHEIPRLRQWVEDTHIRWGMDGEQRSEDFTVPSEEANTWRAGLDRLLMGYAVGPSDELVADVLPFAGATATEADLLGRLVAFVSTLFGHLRGLRRPRPLATWADDLRRAVDDLYQAEDDDEERGLLWVRRVLEQLAETDEIMAGCREDGPGEVTIEVIRAHLEGRLGGEGAGFGFLGGGITFAALKPMRSLPFEVLCVAGLDDASFPRRNPPRSFDLIAAKPRFGDRSPRDDDRQLFLETVLAARRQLVLSYVGRSQRDSSEHPPSVVVSELFEAVDRSFRSADDERPHRHLLVEHRLQPWSPAYFAGDVGARLRSYSHENFEGAVALSSDRVAATPFAVSRAPVDEPLEIDLGDLAEMWVNPCRGYCRQVLKLYLDSYSSAAEDAEPFTVDSLAGYGIRSRLLKRRLSDESLSAAEELELLRAAGELPLAELAGAAYAKIDRELRDFIARLPPHRPAPPRIVELEGADWSLTGRIDDLTDGGLLRYRPARVKAKDLIRAWIVHVVWNTWARHQTVNQHRGEPLETVVVGSKKRYRFAALDDPRHVLESLVAGYRKGLERPLPLFENASYFFADQRRLLANPKSRLRKRPRERAAEGWRGTDYLRGDSQDPYVALCFRDQDPLASDSFETWADYFWGPLFECMSEERQ